ncbi:MAG: hypothetical protein JO314_13855 [Acidobacteria bacterium]|nr:hypothetical protein [Acidobacteriota bacterium]
MAPGQNRDQHNWTNLNTQAWQGRRGDRDRDRNMRANSATYYTYDPLTSYLPRQSRVQVYNYYNGSGYNGYNSGYGNYNPYSSYGYYAPPQNTIVRTIIASYFAPDDAYYADYYTPQYFSYQAPAYYYDYPGDYSYSPAGYSYSYAPAGYYQDGYYDPYQFGGVPMFASPFYGDNSVKASLLSFGVQMLQGLLGQGYVQGLNYGHYYRTYNPGVYYDPYQPSDVAYYSPYVSSFADQRQTFEQGYRLGYEDAMRNQDPYGNLYGNERVDLVSQFLANSLIGS